MTSNGTTGLDVFPLCLGGNVFSWTADEQASFAVLDAYRAAGGNFIDTADTYSSWLDGHTGGESEEIIGRWHTARGNRDEIVIATKVGMKPDREGLAPATVRAAAEESLKRLRTDRIDVYYAHADDESTPLEETLAAFDELVREGKVVHVAASNYSAARLAEALAVSDREGLARYSILQPRYNLMDRSGYEDELAPLCEREGIGCVPFFGLAQGFLTGKYRPGSAAIDSPRAENARGYLDERGIAVLEVLDELAEAHETSIAAVALGWLAAQPTVLAPVASARNPEQLAELLPFAELRLADDDVQRLSAAAATS
jgi:aryl-alcohol dehydrogenase-like predicted oxidoreductase